jgi:hypothetical protein
MKTNLGQSAAPITFYILAAGQVTKFFAVKLCVKMARQGRRFSDIPASGLLAPLLN